MKYEKLSAKQRATIAALPNEIAVMKALQVTQIVARELRRAVRREAQKNRKPLPLAEQQKLIEGDWRVKEIQKQLGEMRTKYAAALNDNAQLKRTTATALKLAEHKPKRELAFKNTNPKKHRVVAVALASDWHAEEDVTGAQTNGINTYNLEVFKQRSERFFVHLVQLVRKEAASADVQAVLLYLLGDFISGNIHPDLVSAANLEPAPALFLVQGVLADGINYLCDQLAPVQVSVDCLDGNHDRITAKMRISARKGNSLAWYMYHTLAQLCPKADFNISDSLFSYTTVLGTIIRARHGDDIRYGGGIGGITIPINKAIAQDNKARRADLDVMGHFHQRVDGGNFLVNGSLIGYGPFSQFIHAPFERPQQTFALIDSLYGKTGVFPIIV